jgi:hypothetical protein
MPSRTPRSYDEIVRRTVPNPDSSWRPSFEAERGAIEGRVAALDDKALLDDIHDALILAGIDASGVRVEVDGDHVVVRGLVRDHACADRIANVIEKVPGVRTLVDQLSW